MIKFFKFFNWFSPTSNTWQPGVWWKNSRKNFPTDFPPSLAYVAAGGVMKKFKKIFLTDFPSKQQGVFFFFFFKNFKLIFFFRFPLVVDGLGSVHQRTKKYIKTESLLFGLTGTLKSRNFLSAGPSSSARFLPWSCPSWPLRAPLRASESQYESHNSSYRFESRCESRFESRFESWYESRYEFQ